MAFTAPTFKHTDGAIFEAIQFRLDDDTTHWHVNKGHPVLAPLKDKFWVQTAYEGAKLINDTDWVLQDEKGKRIVMSDDEFGAAFTAVSE